MRRYLILFLLLVLLIPSLVIPASATQQGVINAVNDGNEWLELIYGVGNDIFITLESIYGYFFEDSPEFVYDYNGNIVYESEGVEKTLTYFQYDLWELKLEFMAVIDDTWVGQTFDYFFTVNRTFYYSRFAWSESDGLIFSSARTTGTRFQEDLSLVSSRVVEGLYQGFRYIYNGILDIANSVTNFYNYFAVKDENIFITKYYFSSGEMCGDVEEITVSSFFADLKDLLDPFESLLEMVVFGENSHNSEIDDEVNADQTEASEILDVLDDVTKPDEGELEDISDISDYVNSSDVSALSDVLKPLFDSAVFLPCIMLNLTFMLVGYVLFGKR